MPQANTQKSSGRNSSFLSAVRDSVINSLVKALSFSNYAWPVGIVYLIFFFKIKSQMNSRSLLADNFNFRLTLC
ncbi:MAG: hypothetical protein C0168_05130 [Candidatus Aminicenantes bacterium]|nr:MAG: hypothetical protein C0168_05130 [Candidatus Aminicenantes bacterium]